MLRAARERSLPDPANRQAPSKLPMGVQAEPPADQSQSACYPNRAGTLQLAAAGSASGLAQACASHGGVCSRQAWAARSQGCSWACISVASMLIFRTPAFFPHTHSTDLYFPPAASALSRHFPTWRSLDLAAQHQACCKPDQPSSLTCRPGLRLRHKSSALQPQWG